MDKEKEKELIEYAETNNIEIRKYTPDFRSKSKRHYVSTIIHAKKKSSKTIPDEDKLEYAKISEDEIMEISESSRE